MYSIHIQWDWAFTECRWCELRKYKFKWTYDCRSDNCNLRNCKLTRKKLREFKGIRALQYPTNWAMKTHTLGAAGIFAEFILIDPLGWPTAMIISSFEFVFPQFTSSSFSSFLSRVKMYARHSTTSSPGRFPRLWRSQSLGKAPWGRGWTLNWNIQTNPQNIVVGKKD